MHMVTLWLALTVLNPVGVPFIQNFPAEVTGGHGQNWSIHVGPEGRLFFANTWGLLCYDGATWRLARPHNGSIMRSIASDAQGRLFYGAEGELGRVRFHRDRFWSLESLVPKLPEKARGFRHVWGIHDTRDGVVFVTPNGLFRYRTEADTFDVIEPKNQFHTSFKVDGALYIREFGVGLQKLGKAGLEPVPGGDFFSDKRLHVFLPYDEGRYFMGTYRHGTWLYRPDAANPKELLERFHPEAPTFFEDYNLYQGIRLNEDRFALATRLNGLVVMNREGRFLLHLDKKRGLADDSVFHLGMDGHDHLWVATNDGISMVDLYNPISRFPERMGIEATPFTAALHKNRLFLGTFRGVLSRPWTPPHSGLTDDWHFTLVPGFQSSSWCFLADGDDLLVGSKQEVFRIRNQRASIMTAIESPVFSMLIPAAAANRLVLGARNGLKLMRRVDGDWSDLQAVEGFEQNCEFMVETKNGDLWISNMAAGAFKVRLDYETGRLLSMQHYGKAQGLPEDSQSKVFLLDGELFVTTTKGNYCYDPASDRMVRATVFDAFLEPDTGLEHLVTAPNGEVWLQARRDFSDRTPSEASQKVFHLVGPANRRRLSQNGESELAHSLASTIVPIDDGRQVLFVTPQGVLAYNGDMQTRDRRFRARIAAIHTPGSGEPIAFMQTSKADEILELAPDRNALRFAFAQDFLAFSDKIAYQFYLEGFDPEWLPWTFAKHRDYTNLPPGAYRFHLRARNHLGQVSNATSVAFRIAPQVWQTRWFKSLLILALAAMIWAAHRFATRFLVLRAEKLERLVAKRTHELEKAQRDLVESARLAGMADIATSVLHDVGNTLNSVVISTQLVKQLLANSKMVGIFKANRVLDEVLDDLAQGEAAEADRQQRLRAYYARLGEAYTSERTEGLAQLDRLEDLVRVLRDIVKAQEQIAGSVSFRDRLQAKALIEQVLILRAGSLQRADVRVTKRIADVPDILGEKLKLIHVFVALIDNAIEAMTETAKTDRSLEIHLFKRNDWVHVIMRDSGCGFDAKVRERLFQQGFTTKKDHSGYDLHRCANFMAEMEGTLTLTSDGPDRGATAEVTLVAMR
ncbi:GHKL domain-containing protein [Sulfidibacter corallicola]|uniref:GHKL domain-containing protein n=1 Tax=Sulfidibacter corallicola TaxID=2818388 RepID=A0A8A4TMW5_SULCO|nr:ATP-binding protein [Sulfidibacter corallicola]QTD50787.1 GHKL domain-containing protein [Sulfidibacter corallicola]